MRLAARRGVRVELIVPLRSNHWLADIRAAARSTTWLAPSATDAADVARQSRRDRRRGGACGSANLDARSLFLSFELMIAFYAPADIETLTRWIEHTFAAARPYTPTHTGSPHRRRAGALARFSDPTMNPIDRSANLTMHHARPGSSRCVGGKAHGWRCRSCSTSKKGPNFSIADGDAANESVHEVMGTASISRPTECTSRCGARMADARARCAGLPMCGWR